MVPSFKLANIEQLANVLGATDSGLTGSEIGRYLSEVGIPDPEPRITKRIRLAEALKAKQAKDGCANNICSFIERVMAPSMYVDRAEVFEQRHQVINSVLSFEGLNLKETGKITVAKKANTISEAQEAAIKLKSKLQERGVHHEVLKFCQEELVKDNYFHAVLEAAKSVAQKIREKSGFSEDGSELVEKAFGIGKKQFPTLALNALQTDSEKSEHNGVLNLLKGFFGIFRNPTAHSPKIHWQVSERDALDMLTVASMLHRKIDMAVKTGF